MNLENRTLTIDSQVSNEEINELVSKIVLDIDEIDKIEIKNLENGVQTSALFALLHVIKKRKAEIKIPCYEKYENISNMGKVLFVK